MYTFSISEYTNLFLIYIDARLSIQILTKRASIDIKKRFVYSEIEKVYINI